MCGCTLKFIVCNILFPCSFNDYYPNCFGPVAKRVWVAIILIKTNLCLGYPLLEYVGVGLTSLVHLWLEFWSHQ